MHRLMAGGAFGLILLLSIDAAACQFDNDCPGGGRCVKTFGDREGVCERGVAPPHGQPERNVGGRDRPKGLEGQRCEFGGDCANGLYCMQTSNPEVRVCRPY